MTRGLERLLGAREKEKFQSLAGCRELRDIPAFLEALSAAPDEIRVAAWTGARLERVLPKESAKTFFGLPGLTIVVHGAQALIPAVSGLLEEIQRDLGLSSGCRFCVAYLSPAGAGTGMHFDFQDSFILQVRGRKRWTIAPNKNVPDPRSNYSVANSGPRPEGFPTAMPEEARSLVLKPGSVLFLPRGYWHETRALEDSLSLTLSFQRDG